MLSENFLNIVFFVYPKWKLGGLQFNLDKASFNVELIKLGLFSGMIEPLRNRYANQ